MKTTYKSRPLLVTGCPVDKPDGSRVLKITTLTFEEYELDPETDGEIKLTILAGFVRKGEAEAKLVNQLRDHLVANLGPGIFKDYLEERGGKDGEDNV